MSASSPAASSPRPERPKQRRVSELPELNVRVPAETPKHPIHSDVIPEELLASLTSTVCGMSSPGHQHYKDCGIRRPDAVWHHPLGRKKYKHFLEQPMSWTGAGRDISFLCDTMATQKKTRRLPPLADKSDNMDTQELSVTESLIPDEYHIVKNKGLQGLELYEDAFTVQLQDDEQKLRAFPSLRPSGRLEVVKLMRIMDDMLEKAGVDEQSEQLSELSQMQGLLELVQMEQNIYNIVFHELIRQVSVGCTERGQLLAKLRQRYQSLMERIPRSLKALHTEALAQRALDRRLVEEILHIKTSIQQLNTQLSGIRDHDAFVSQQAAQAQEQLTKALDQAFTNSDVVQGYHELYELQRRRLEDQLQQLTDERDCWSQLTFSFALKVISMKKLRLVSRLHSTEQSWSKIAEHCSMFLSSKDTEDMNVMVQLTGAWKEQLTAFMSQLKKTECSQREQIQAMQEGIAKWVAFCTAQKMSPNLKYEKAPEEELHTDLKEWSNMLTLQCERYSGEELFSCQQTLSELCRLQERWLDLGLQLFRRHQTPDGSAPEGQRSLMQLDRVVSELHNQLDTQVSGESGIHRQIMALVKSMEVWVAKLEAVIGRPDGMSVSDWLKLEKALCTWQSLSEEALQNVSSGQTEKEKSTNEPHLGIKMEDVFGSMQEFVTGQSNFFDCEDQRLCDEVGSIHMALTRWMLDLLLLIVPDHSEGLKHDQDQEMNIRVSLQKLEEDAMMLSQKLEFFSRYITSSCRLILEEQIQKNPHQNETESEMNECTNLQRECSDWLETCRILLSDVKGGPVDLSVRHPGPDFSGDVAVSLAERMDSPVNEEEIPAEISVRPSDAKDETEADPKEITAGCHEPEQHEISQQVELMVCENPVLKQIGYDGSIVQRMLGESNVHLSGTKELVPSPVTEEAQKGFDHLTTVGLLQQELYDSELRVQSAEQRALNAEEALQAALVKIQDLERRLQEKMKTPDTQVVTATPPSTKSSAEAKPSSRSRKTKKQ
ncbi:axonemal dynein light chain domain-containing protein 1 [Genypterus blacodes]|uniref:axonemal dynein light chain domain-containing protein 1 n=1 Tax=Genypterus blacodes TaxID=154954 RepID=UPI003F76D5AE